MLSGPGRHSGGLLTRQNSCHGDLCHTWVRVFPVSVCLAFVTALAFTVAQDGVRPAAAVVPAAVITVAGALPTPVFTQRIDPGLRSDALVAKG